MIRTLLFAALLSCLTSAINAQISLTEAAPTYTNNFDDYRGDAATLPNGVATSPIDFEGTATGSRTSGGFYAFIPDVPGSTDYALGVLRSNNATFSYTFTFVNDGADDITALDFSYNFEQYRYAGNTTGFEVSSDAGDVSQLSQAGATSGTNGVPSSIPKTATLSSIQMTPGATFTLVFTQTNEGGSDNGIAVDDLEVTATYFDPLPVALVSFDATPVGNTAELSWVVASERDNAFFAVEVSRDGTAFEEAGRINGAGTSSYTTAYDFAYRAPTAGQYYFRLAQHDYDGQVNHSPVVVAQLGQGGKDFGINGPNVTHDRLIVDLQKDTNLRIVDMRGATLLNLVLAAGQQVIDVADLATGMYVLTDGQTAVRFVR